MIDDENNPARSEPLKHLEAPTLFKGKDPLFGLQLIDNKGISGEVWSFMYVPEKYPIPQGLGQLLPNYAGSARAKFPPQPGKWVTQPEECQMYVLKLAHQHSVFGKTPTQVAYQLDAEILSLRVLNDLFPDEAFGRPPKIYGFGLQETNNLGNCTPYLIMEYIGIGTGGSFLPLEKYLKTQPVLQAKEALTVATRLAFVINKAHRAGITHGDLEEGILNIFWDPTAGKIRLIDWANSNNILLNNDPSKGLSYGYDRKGVGELLFQLLTGNNLSEVKKQYPNQLPEYIWQQVPAQARIIIERSCGLSRDGYNPFKPEETTRMLADLDTALRS